MQCVLVCGEGNEGPCRVTTGPATPLAPVAAAAGLLPEGTRAQCRHVWPACLPAGYDGFSWPPNAMLLAGYALQPPAELAPVFRHTVATDERVAA